MTGADVRRIRKRLGLTQVELAERLGVAPNSVARWERGEMGLRATAEKLLMLLDQAAPVAPSTSGSGARSSQSRKKKPGK